MKVRRIEKTEREKQPLWVCVLPACSSLFSQKGALFIHLKEHGEALPCHSRCPSVSASNCMFSHPVSVSFPFLSQNILPFFLVSVVLFSISLSVLYLLHTHLILLPQRELFSCFMATCLQYLYNVQVLISSWQIWHLVFYSTVQLMSCAVILIMILVNVSLFFYTVFFHLVSNHLTVSNKMP